MDHGFTFRPDTMDETMFNHIMAHDEYHLPDAFEPDDLVIDIGVHIGTFCYKVLQRGSNRVFGFEADQSNYECAARNLKRFEGRLTLRHAAVWRSDRAVESLKYTYSSDPTNTGGGTVVWGIGESHVPVIPFDRLLAEVTEGGRRRVRLLKLDCEASEFPILLTSRKLHLIEEIAGEFHEMAGDFDQNTIPDHVRIEGYNRYTIQELTDVLTRAGFAVTSERHGTTSLGLFHAVRPAGSVPRPALFKGRVQNAWNALKARLSA
jgi:FkbM family methyltransferase